MKVLVMVNHIVEMIETNKNYRSEWFTQIDVSTGKTVIVKGRRYDEIKCMIKSATKNNDPFIEIEQYE